MPPSEPAPEASLRGHAYYATNVVVFFRLRPRFLKNIFPAGVDPTDYRVNKQVQYYE